MRSVVNSGEAEVSTIIFINKVPSFVDISYHPAFIATHIITHLTSQKVQQPAVFYAEKRINERCHGDGMQVAYVSNVTRPRDAIQRLGINKC